jgi:hypothetical protein
MTARPGRYGKRHTVLGSGTGGAMSRPLTAALLAFVLSTGAAHAGDCWVADAAHATTGPRAAQLERTAQLLRRDSAINAVQGVRYELHRHASVAQHAGAPGAAETAVWLHAPDAWQGRCGLKAWAGNVYPATLSVHFNDLAAVMTEAAPEGGGLQATLAPRETARVGGYPVYEGRLLVITPRGLPPFVPVSAGQWLDAWQRHLDAAAAETRADLGEFGAGDWAAAVAQVERQDPAAAADLRRSLAEAQRLATEADPTGERAALQAWRASLSPAALAAPAWVSSAAADRQRFALASPDAPGAQAVVQVNPALWRGAGPAAVRVVALQVYLNRPETFDGPDSPLDAAARGWLQRVQPQPYAALLTP